VRRAHRRVHRATFAFLVLFLPGLALAVWRARRAPASGEVLVASQPVLAAWHPLLPLDWDEPDALAYLSSQRAEPGGDLPAAARLIGRFEPVVGLARDALAGGGFVVLFSLAKGEVVACEAAP
jgi:hypothetical protein